VYRRTAVQLIERGRGTDDALALITAARAAERKKYGDDRPSSLSLSQRRRCSSSSLLAVFSFSFHPLNSPSSFVRGRGGRYVCDSSERSAELLKKLHQRIDEAGHMVRHPYLGPYLGPYLAPYLGPYVGLYVLPAVMPTHHIHYSPSSRPPSLHDTLAQVREAAERERAARAASDEAMRRTIDGATAKPVALKPSQIKR